MSRAKRQARRQARRTARAARRASGPARLAARTAAAIKAPARPAPAGLANLTNAPGLQEPAGGPSLAAISQGQTTPATSPNPGIFGPGPSGTLQDIGNDPFKAAGQPTDFGPPEMGGTDIQPETQAVETVEAVEDLPQGEDFSDIIGSIIGGAGQAVGGILKGLNINSGVRKKQASDSIIAAYQAKQAAAQAAKGPQPQAKSKTGLYIGIGAAALILIVVGVMVMKKKK